MLVRAINAHLPADVVVREAAEVPESFDANRDAKRKLYRYVIHDGDVPDPFLRRYAYHSRHRLDAAAMARAAEPLRGRHDFHSFETDWPNRAVERADDHAPGGQPLRRLDLARCGGGRLPVQYGAGHRRHADQRRPRLLAGIEQVAAILHAEDRTQAGPTAPAQGLFLMRVTYER